MSITITKIAELTGVSKSTAHRALSGASDISETMRQKILDCARSHNYQPNLSARVLVGAKTWLLALYGLDFGNVHFAQFLRGASRVADAAGYHLLTVSSSDKMNHLRHLGIEGVAAFFGSSSEIAGLYNLQIPMVRLIKQNPNGDEAAVSSGVRYGAALLVRYLLEKGHRRIGHLSVSQPDDMNVPEKLAGYQNALADAGVPYRPELVVSVDFYTERCGYEGARKLLSLPEPPTVIFAQSDILATGAYRAARELGLRIPEDISIAGYDDKEYAALLFPALTTVRTPYQQLGAYTMECLIAEIENRPRPSGTPLLPVLAERSSVADINLNPETENEKPCIQPLVR